MLVMSCFMISVLSFCILGEQIKEKLNNLTLSQVHLADHVIKLKKQMNTALPLLNKAAIIGPEETKLWLSLLEEIDNKTVILIQQYQQLASKIDTLLNQKKRQLAAQETQLIISFIFITLSTLGVLTLLGLWNSRRIIQPLTQLSLLSKHSSMPKILNSAPLEIKTISQKLVSAFANLAKEKGQVESANKQIALQNQTLQETITRLEETRAKLVENEKLASIGQLAAGVAHEINNPVGYVMSNLESLEDYIEDMSAFIKHVCELKETIPQISLYHEQFDIEFTLRDLPELLESSHAGLKRVKSIVKDLRAFSYDMPNYVEVIEITSVIEQSVNLVKPSLPNGVKLVSQFDSQATLKGSTTKLVQVFVNLIINAADAIQKQGNIYLSVFNEGNKIKITITDDGCGMDTETQKNIFNPFYTTKAVGKGTGLGLHIGLTIIKSHGGNIDVESEINQGTCFTVTLPASSEDHHLKTEKIASDHDIEFKHS